MLCILGSIVIIIHSPKDQDVQSIDELSEKIFQSGTSSKKKLTTEEIDFINK